MKCYKGFDKDLRCKDFQYEIIKESVFYTLSGGEVKEDE